MSHPEVVIVGSGLAGLVAAVELQKRGFKVTLLERGGPESIGGKIGTHLCDQCTGVHLHTHHIFMNWYRNFWKVVEDLGWDTGETFEPRETVNYLRSTTEMPGASYDSRLSSVTNEGSIWHALDNMMDGPESPANMFLYGYSLLDLITKPYRRETILDNTSVNGFMASRWYATPQAAMLHQRFLSVAFANASFQTSAETYKNFIRFSTVDPVPQYYVMKQGVRERLISELRSKLLRGDPKANIPPGSIETGITLVGIVLGTGSAGGSTKAVKKLEVLKAGGSPGAVAESEIELKEGTSIILAVSLDGLIQLVDEDLYEASSNFQRVHSLRSQTIASLELQYQKKVEGIPRNHTALMNSPHHLSLFDGTQVSCSEGVKPQTGTNLTVSISEFDALDAWDQQHPALRTSWNRKRRAKSASTSGANRNWDRVKNMIFAEVQDFLPELPVLKAGDRMCLVRNSQARLFINDVHDWSWQPTTDCEGIENLFLAGEYVQNPIDVVTVESAVVTGLQAAESVRARANHGKEVEIIRPEAYSTDMARNAVAALAPMALGAATLARTENIDLDPYRAFAENFDNWLDNAESFWRAMNRIY
ncbi:MAG TPA: FAD-dependent oxidoreductase [Terriglobales bacterium]